jgi:hypothetical protein
LSIVLLAGTAVVLAATVAGAGFALEDAATTEPTPTATFSASASGDRIELVHRGGEPLEVERLRLRISVDGEELARQPDVPFFSQRGFRPGPTGPFNTASDVPASRSPGATSRRWSRARASRSGSSATGPNSLGSRRPSRSDSHGAGRQQRGDIGSRTAATALTPAPARP